MNQLIIIIGICIFALGYGLGHHAKTVSTNAATVKQVTKVAKIEAKNEVQVEKQNDSDKLKIRKLEDDLADAHRAARNRGVPKPPVTSCVSQTQGDAGDSEGSGAAGESARRYEEAYRAFRDELLTSGAVAEALRLKVLACQAQWPH